MITKTISKIEKIIFSTFLATVVLLLLGYFFLSEGVEIRSLSLFGLNIEKLYLKLDKKLIVRAKKVQIPSATKRTDTNLDPYLWMINALPKLFQTVDIKDISWRSKYHLRLRYQDGIFTLRSKEFILRFSLWMDKNLHLFIQRLHLPRYNLSLQGEAKIKHSDFDFKGKYRIESITGSLSLQKQSKDLFYWVRSDTFSNHNLAKLFSHIPVDPLIKEWSYRRIIGRDYKLHYLKGQWRIGTPFDLRSVEALATAKELKVRFNDSLPPVLVKKVALHLSDGNLYFKLFGPRYLNKDLRGSKVTIYRVGQRGSYLLLHLRTTSPFDKDIKKLLAAYRIKIPIIQKKGVLQADLDIKIVFKNFSTDVQGRFRTQDSLVTIKGLDLYLKKAYFKIHNDYVVIRPSVVAIDPFVTSRLYGTIDISKAKGDFHLHILRLHIDQGAPLLLAKDIQERLLLDLTRSKAHLVYFDTDIFFDRIKQIHIHRLQKLIPFSPLLQKLAPLRGSLEVKLTPSIDFLAKIEKPNDICYKAHHPITTFHLTGHIRPHPKIHMKECGTLFIDRTISATIQNVWIKLPDLNSNSSIEPNRVLLLRLKNVTLFRKNHLIPFDEATISLKKGHIALEGRYKNGSIHGWMQEGNVTLEGKNLGSDFVNKLLGKKVLKGGSFDLEVKGKKDDLIGKIYLKRTTIEKLKLLNNLFAAINTIPALVTLHNPGFSSEGLFVKNGVIEFRYRHGRLLIQRLHLVSYSLEFDGFGTIDPAHDTIQMNLWLKTLKSITDIISKIPIAGYILLGKDGSIAISLEITGSLKDPKITTHAAKDTIKAPFNIIKRTLTLPFKLFE